MSLMSVNATVTGDAAVVRRLRPDAADQPVHRFLTRGALIMEGELKAHVRVDTGGGRRSLTHQVGNDYAVAGTNLLYLKVMARGRKPGRPMPPPGALLGWMRRHGMDPGPKRGKAIYHANEFLLARKIGRVGIKGDDFDKKARASAEPRIRAQVPVLAREIAASLGGS